MNIAKGRIVELYARVESNDPSTSALVLVPLSATDTEANRQDDDNLSVFLAATPNEQTAGGWVRKVLTDTELASVPAPEDTGNKYIVSLPEVKWTEPETGSNVVALAVCYDPKTGEGTDTEILVLTVHDFAVTADGNDVILNAGSFLSAA
jgi:hypothetical protein